VPAKLRRAIDARFSGKAKSTGRLHSNGRRDPVGPTFVAAESVTVQYGGVIALSEVSIEAATGTITGLIGPNGAGKTTLFNACTGYVIPRSGRVILGGHDVTRRGIPTRARGGIGRTFQRMELCDSLTVRDNVLMGAEGVQAGANPWRHAIARRGDLARARADAEEAIGLCGLDDLSEEKVATLSTGRRRLVELARTLAGPYRVLLLDEPSSGLDSAETTAFGRILRAVVAERNVGILLVEHDMSLVLDVCDSIHVLDFGRRVFHGTPAEAMASPIVQEAYLGGSTDKGSPSANEQAEVDAR
jgi:ABC-type branched-subunit amino acid transport system ATPase component